MTELAVTTSPASRRDASTLRKTVAWVRQVPYAAALLAAFLVCAELSARIQDRIVAGTSLLASPDWDRDLFTTGPAGRQGKPHGRFKKWQLNAFGFRSPEMSPLPETDSTRVVLLGASETFGLYESPGMEYSAQLAKDLARAGRFEVVNAAVPGMTLASASRYYRVWVSTFRPSVVVLYPSPLFYLNDTPPHRTPREQDLAVPHAPVDQNPAPAFGPGSLRIVQRLKDTFDVPDILQRQRDAHTIETEVRGRADGWLFTSVPQERVDRFIDDLAALAAEVKASGGVLIVATHSSRVSTPSTSDDREWLWRARVNSPRATPDVIAAFEVATNAATRQWAAANHVQLLDVAAGMNGHTEYFGDLVHFNDAGAARIARLMATAIAEAAPAKGTVDAVQ